MKPPRARAEFRRTQACLRVDRRAGRRCEPALGRCLHHAAAPGRGGCRAYRRGGAQALGARGVLRPGRWRRAGGRRPDRRPAGSEIRAGLRQPGATAHGHGRARRRAARVTPVRGHPARRPGANCGGIGGPGRQIQHRRAASGSSRLCVAVRDPAAVNETALSKAVRAVARPAPDTVHLVIGPEAGSWFAGMTVS